MGGLFSNGHVHHKWNERERCLLPCAFPGLDTWMNVPLILMFHGMPSPSLVSTSFCPPNSATLDSVSSLREERSDSHGVSVAVLDELEQYLFQYPALPAELRGDDGGDAPGDTRTSQLPFSFESQDRQPKHSTGTAATVNMVNSALVVKSARELHADSGFHTPGGTNGQTPLTINPVVCTSNQQISARRGSVSTSSNLV